MTTPATPALGFSLTIPHDWFEVPLAPSNREPQIASLVYERTRYVPELRPARAGITKLVRDYAEQAWDVGAVYCACFVDPGPEGPISGSLVVMLIDAPPGPTHEDGGEATDGLLDALMASPNDPHSDRVVSTATLPEVGVVARTHGVEMVALPDGPRIKAVIMQTFVPIPDQRRIALITASSPVTWLEEPLLELFDAVTATFRFVGSSQTRV